MSIFSLLNWEKVRAHYDEREQTHHRLLDLHQQQRLSAFVDLLLGISNPSGNYSAAEYGIGPKVLAENLNVEKRLLTIANQFLAITNAHEVPPIIRSAGLKYFQIGVGSEASCLLNPKHCWVANVRTIWTHLVQKHDDSFEKADEELQLYRESAVESEMSYQMWRTLHAELAGTITRTAEQGAKLAIECGIQPGLTRYLWADAMASQLYDDRHGKDGVRFATSKRPPSAA